MANVQAVGPTLAETTGNVALQGPGCGHCNGPDEPLGLPAGFPASMPGETAWPNDKVNDEKRFVHDLTESDLAEMRAGLALFNASGLGGTNVNRENFPLPTLGAKLQRLGDDLYNGSGLCVIRGINTDDYSVGDLTTIWLGIQAYVADQRGRQDNKGHMLVHIIADDSSKMARGHHRHSRAPITFHNEEAGDVIAWLTRSTAASGGKCIVASVHKIYNFLAENRPDVIRTLAKSDWPIALPRFQCRPLMFYHNSRLMMNFGRTPLLGNAVHPRSEKLPKVNESQREALDIVEATAKAFQMEIKTQAGDMHFINNFTVLHRREGFTDGPEPQQKRHLVRMRLRNSELGWDIPEELKKDWKDAFEGNANRCYDIEPMPGNKFPLRKHTN